MASFLDVCRFNPTAGSTTDWTVSSAVTGYQTPASAGAVNGAIYRYRAESADLSQWEIGYGAYTVAGTVLARTTVLFNSSGGTSKINFTLAPQVAVVLLAEDLGALQPGQIPGISSNTAATAGNVGEYISSTVLAGSAVSLTTNVAANVTSVSLTAGDWQCTGAVFTTTAGAPTYQFLEAWISTASATQPTRPNSGMDTLWNGSTTSNIGQSAGSGQIIINSTTTVFLGTLATFSSTASAYGFIGCRRVR